MRKQQPVLPSTVVDQIRLWDMEGQRLDSVEGYIYDDFLSESDFDLVANYARELGVMMWELKARKKLCVSVEGHGQVR
jgi:transcription initiation factor TFIIH subunit 4